MGCIVLSVFFFAILRVVAGKPLLALLQRLIIFVSFKRVFCILLLTSSANEGESFLASELLQLKPRNLVNISDCLEMHGNIHERQDSN